MSRTTSSPTQFPTMAVYTSGDSSLLLVKKASSRKKQMRRKSEEGSLEEVSIAAILFRELLDIMRTVTQEETMKE